MQGIKARLDKLNSFRLEQKGDIPPVDSVAFQMRFLMFPIFGRSKLYEFGRKSGGARAEPTRL